MRRERAKFYQPPNAGSSIFSDTHRESENGQLQRFCRGILGEMGNSWLLNARVALICLKVETSASALAGGGIDKEAKLRGGVVAPRELVLGVRHLARQVFVGA